VLGWSARQWCPLARRLVRVAGGVVVGRLLRVAGVVVVFANGVFEGVVSVVAACGAEEVVFELFDGLGHLVELAPVQLSVAGPRLGGTPVLSIILLARRRPLPVVGLLA
jgi:hypothetical protein